jgi:hypothetical protein
MAMEAASKTRQNIHRFTLVYVGVDDLTDEFCDAIFEAGCDDALLGMHHGLVTLDFDREALSYRQALLSAIEDVERAEQPIRLVRVEPL